MFRRIFCAVAVAAVSVAGLAAPSEALASNTPDAGFPAFNDLVKTVVKRGSVVYVGGDFTRVRDSRGKYVRRGAAAFNIDTGRVLPWNPNVSGSVNRLLVTKEGVYVGGEFTKVKGKTRHNLARVSLGGDAKLAAAFHPGTNGAVNAIAVNARQIFVGGDFTRANKATRTRLASFNRGGRFRLTSWAPEANDTVRDLVRTKAGIFVAGQFRKFNTRPAYERLALVNPKSGRLVLSFNPTTRVVVLDIAVTKGRVYAALGGPGGGLAVAVRRSDSRTLWQRRFDGDVQALMVYKGALYVGGHFNEICATDNADNTGDCLDPGAEVRRRGAALTGAGDLRTWDPAGNGSMGVETMVGARGKVVLGGDFTTMNSGATSTRRLAVFSNVA